VAVFDIRLDTLREFETIHFRHHDVAHNEIDIGITKNLQRLYPVLCHNHMVMRREKLLFELQQLSIILNQQQGLIRNRLYGRHHILSGFPLIR